MPALGFVLPYFLVLILSLSFHEAAHAWMANRLGDPTARMLGRLTINPLAHIDWIGTVLFPLIAIYSGLPLIGWAKPVPVNTQYLRSPRRDFAIVAAAGPASNVILAVGLAIVLRVMLEARDYEPSLTTVVLMQAVTMNVLLAIFNLLPVPPLDGGNVLAGLVPERAAQLIDALRPYGIIILYVLLLSGVIGAIATPVMRAIRPWLS